ncbi:MAG TPA: hypothetical protein VFR82_02340 [Nitrospira sp.]|nr:hypothetical protein [Nitrospira sp.]
MTSFRTALTIGRYGRIAGIGDATAAGFMRWSSVAAKDPAPADHGRCVSPD